MPIASGDEQPLVAGGSDFCDGFVMSAMLDARLERIAALSWERAAYLSRVGRLVERYERLTALSSVAVALEAEVTMGLLFAHPSALLERSALDRQAIEVRLEGARSELRNLRAAAPLPPPPDRRDRTLALAVADLEWLLCELKIIRRGARGLSPEHAAARYRNLGRGDPIHGLDADMMRAIAAIRRGGALEAALAIVGVRHRVREPRRFVFPEKTTSKTEERSNRGTSAFACKASEIEEGTAKRIEIFGCVIAVFRDEGVLRAIDDHCPHRGGPLHLGDVDRGAVVCPLHSWAFDLRTGCMRGNPKIRLPTYELTLEGDDVFVSRHRPRGDPE